MKEQQSDEQQQPAEDEVKIDCSRPGELLKKAREAKGLSQDEAAKKLNFLPIYISALENEEFEPLHGVTFVKGYLRAYARFLGIDADEVLHCFAMHHPKLVTQETHQPIDVMKPEKTTNSIAFKLVSLIIAVGLIAIIIIWWQSRTAESLPNVSNQEVKVDTLDGNTIIAPIETQQPEITPVDESSLPKKTVEPLANLEEQAKPPVEEQKVKPVAVVKPDPVVNEEPPLVANKPIPAAPVISPKAFAGDPAAATLNDDKLVVLSFSGECWVEVRDDAGKTLHAALMQENDQIMLKGEPPFNMVFGNGTFAKVFYTGEAFDFSSRIRSNGYAAFQVK